MPSTLDDAIINAGEFVEEKFVTKPRFAKKFGSQEHQDFLTVFSAARQWSNHLKGASHDKEEKAH